MPITIKVIHLTSHGPIFVSISFIDWEHEHIGANKGQGRKLIENLKSFGTEHLLIARLCIHTALQHLLNVRHRRVRRVCRWGLLVLLPILQTALTVQDDAYNKKRLVYFRADVKEKTNILSNSDMRSIGLRFCEFPFLLCEYLDSNKSKSWFKLKTDWSSPSAPTSVESLECFALAIESLKLFILALSCTVGPQLLTEIGSRICP